MKCKSPKSCTKIDMTKVQEIEKLFSISESTFKYINQFSNKKMRMALRNADMLEEFIVDPRKIFYDLFSCNVCRCQNDYHRNLQGTF